MLAPIRGVRQHGYQILEVIQYLAPRGYKTTNNPRSRYTMACPLPTHDDRERPDHSGSFAVNDEQSLFFCFGCGAKGTGYQLHQLLSGNDAYQPPPRAPDPPKLRNAAPAPRGQQQYVRLQGATIHDIAVAKGLDEDYLKNDLSWQDGDWYGTPAILIPYPDDHNGDVRVRYRVGIDSGDRFRWAKGSKPRPYGLWNLAIIKERNFCVLVEGETDYATLDYHGFPVLAVPGSQTFKGEGWAKYLDGIERIYLWAEPDQGGQALVNLVKRSRPDVLVITPPPGIKDPTELADHSGAGFADMLNDLIDIAEPPRSPFADEPIRTCFIYPEKNIRNNFGSSVAGYLNHQKTDLVEAYRTGAFGQANRQKAEYIAGCGVNYRWFRCTNTGSLLARLQRCGDPNCILCAVWLVQEFLEGKAAVLEQHLTDPTVYVTYLFSQRLPTEAGAMSEAINQIYKQIRKIVTRLGDSFGDTRRIARDNVYGIRTEFEGDTAHFELVIMGQREPGDQAFLQEFFRRQTGVESQVQEMRCNDLSHAYKVFGQLMAVRVQWDNVRSYEAWRAGTKGAKLVQGKGAFYKVSGGAKGKVRTMEEKAQAIMCPICGVCTPIEIPGLHPIATSPVRHKVSEWTGITYLEPEEVE